MNTHKHKLENTHTHPHYYLHKLLCSRVTQVSHCLGIVPSAWTAPSDTPAFLKFPIKSLLLWVLLTTNNGYDLTCHKYFIIKIVSLRYELSLTFLPPIFKLSFCIFSFSQFSLLLPKVKLLP